MKLSLNGGDVDDPDWCDDDRFHIYGPKDIKATTRFTVHVPKDVGLGSDDGPITTNHLLGFAGTDYSPDVTWCFNTSERGRNGEYAILMHDQDEPLSARYIRSGAYIDAKHAKAKHKDLAGWLTAYVDAITKKSPDKLIDF